MRGRQIHLLSLFILSIVGIRPRYYDGSSVSFDDLANKGRPDYPDVFLPEAGIRPSVGAIRWDAWNQYEGKYDPISFYTQKVMSPQPWQFRLPFFAQSLSSSNVSFNGDVQSVMDVEILYANHSGIDYWAFDTYCAFGANCATSSSFCKQYCTQTSKNYCPRKPTYALDLFLSSKYVNKMHFSLIMLGSPACDPNMQDMYIRYMKNAQFQTVMGGRPLLYLFQFDDQEAQACGSGWSGSRKVFDAFRAKVQKAGLKNPYIVLMDFDIALTKSHAVELGFDAISSYALPGGTKAGSPFSQLHSNAMAYWTQSAATNFPMVPIAPTGWDPRPRAQNPPPFVNEGPEHFNQATGDEIQDLLIDAVTWTCKNAQKAQAQTILVYAWNESSENGACLIPNLGNSTLYVEALSSVLPMQCPK